MVRKAATAALLCLALPSLAIADVTNENLPGAMPGEPAPPLTVSKWLRGEPLKRFEPGRMYAIDLWSTWCVPCLEAMPELRRLEEKYADNLTIVAMSTWEVVPERVPAFFEQWKDSMVHWVAQDSVPAGEDGNEGLTTVSYVGPYIISPLPRTYLIDSEGIVAWAGHPAELETRYLEVRTGTWDRSSFADSFKAVHRYEIGYQRHVARIEAKMEAQDWEGAYEESEAAIDEDPAYATEIVRFGFASLARRIVYMEPSAAEGQIALRAAERAVALTIPPEWGLYELAADAAAAAGDNHLFRNHMQKAIEVAPDDEKVLLEAKLEALDTEAGKH